MTSFCFVPRMLHRVWFLIQMMFHQQTHGCLVIDDVWLMVDA